MHLKEGFDAQGQPAGTPRWCSIGEGNPFLVEWEYFLPEGIWGRTVCCWEVSPGPCAFDNTFMPAWKRECEVELTLGGSLLIWSEALQIQCGPAS